LCFILCVLLGLLAVQAFAQEATIVGTVTDPSGATIPNAAVTTVNTQNNQVTHFVTSSDGQYLAPGLQVGHYSVRVEVPGFKKAEQKDIILNVGDRARVDFKLEIGSATESVTVEATPVAVQTESGEVSDVITSQQVTQLSVNGRSIYGLTALMAGASSNMPDVNTPTAVGGNATVSYNGNRSSHNIYLLDGGEDLDRGGSGTMSVAPSIDALGEFRTLTSNYSADFGLSSAATFTMVLKSGTKDFHASGWEFVRNEDLDANDFFRNQSGLSRSLDRYNVYGFNVGGPVFIPKVYNKDKNKTFFFYNQEWRNIVSSGGLNTTVPLASEYTGSFGSTNIFAPYACSVSSAIAAKFQAAGQALSGCTADANGILQPDKGKVVAFSNNTIPSSLLDANAQAMLKAGIFPSPNSGSAANKFVGGGNAKTTIREEIVRIDHHFTDKFWLFGHWVDDAVDQGFATTMWSGANVPSTGNSFSNPSYSGVIHATYTISPSLLNETAFNYNGNRINILPTSAAAAIANRKTDNVNIPQLFPNGTNLDDRIPAISLGQIGTDYTLNWVPWVNKADDYQVRDDFSWTKGNHQIKFGASYALYKKIQTYFADTEGQFGFSGGYTGNDFADYLLGMASSYSEDGYQGKGHWDNKSPAIYVQDNWKVNKKLTVNLALRWDGIPHTYEESNNQSNFYPNLYDSTKRAQLCGDSVCATSPGLGTSPVAALSGTSLYMNGIGIAGQNGIPDGLVKNAWHNFGPRIGFAYDPVGDGKTVIRGGFGMMYERIQGNDQYNGATNVPFGATASVQNVSLSNPGTSLATGSTVTAPIPIVGITGDNYSDYKPPVSIQYNFGVQRELAKNTVLSVAYVGTANRHQNEYTDINNPDPSVLKYIINNTLDRNIAVPYAGYGGIKLSENDENGHYNSLQTTLHSRVSKDLTFEGAFTYSKAMDPVNASGGNGDMTTVSNPYDRSYDWGPSGLDRRAVLVGTFIYDLPILRGNSGTPLLRATLGGWEVSGIVTAETGMPLGITLGGSQGSNGLANATNRPDASSVNTPHTLSQWFDASSFSSPAVGAWGTLGHNSVYGPGRDNWNISLFKSFTFSESRGSRLEIRAETFNTFNHTQYNGIDTSFSDGSNFGKVTGMYNPRNLQLGVKLLF
jgi:hypothetical protein